jgi:WhiB family redox-sensing transcriptional regulator
MTTQQSRGKEKHMLAISDNLTARQDWWDEALCRDSDAALAGIFFSEELQDIAHAKSICAECPSMAACLEGALERREPLGVWGGQLFMNGKILASKRRRGRPPKNPRPEDAFPEIPVPIHLQSAVTAATRTAA